MFIPEKVELLWRKMGQTTLLLINIASQMPISCWKIEVGRRMKRYVNKFSPKKIEESDFKTCLENNSLYRCSYPPRA